MDRNNYLTCLAILFTCSSVFAGSLGSTIPLGVITLSPHQQISVSLNSLHNDLPYDVACSINNQNLTDVRIHYGVAGSTQYYAAFTVDDIKYDGNTALIQQSSSHSLIGHNLIKHGSTDAITLINEDDGANVSASCQAYPHHYYPPN